MPGLITQHNIGALIKVATSVFDAAASAGTVNGTAIDRAAHNMPLSCAIHADAGAVAGSPTTTSVQYKLQHSADDSTWADYTDPNTGSVAQTAALTAADSEAQIAVDLSIANRWLRLVQTTAFTGGTSPTVVSGGRLVLSGEPAYPAI